MWNHDDGGINNNNSNSKYGDSNDGGSNDGGSNGDDSDKSCCYKCFKYHDQHLLLICDCCDKRYCHTYCSIFGNSVPEEDWLCDSCDKT